MSEPEMWIDGIEGDFPLHNAVVEVMPKGTKVVSAESWGISAWTKTAKISVVLPDGSPKRYFLKCATGKVAKTLAWGEHHSAVAIEALVPDFGPKPVGKGEYFDETNTHVYFYLQNYHDMDLKNPPDPAELASLVAELHRKGKSPNGMFGYPVPTGGGILERTVTWEKSWAAQFTHQLKDVIILDNDANPPWPEYDAACKQVIDHVIPRLLGALQSDGREIEPALVHLDLWEGNLATDLETGKIIIFDPGCVYAHNEIEFGTWRLNLLSRWKNGTTALAYMRLGPRYVIRPAILGATQGTSYNDMLFLCEKYAPLDTLEKYDPEKDISVTGVTATYDVLAGAKNL